MGIRCDQFMGLNKWALNFVNGSPVFVYREEVIRIYPNGRREMLEPRPIYESSVKTEESGEFYYGMFNDKYPLNKYTFPDGRIYFEMVQADPWSSGPIFFLALTGLEPTKFRELNQGITHLPKEDCEETRKALFVKESLWTQEEINNA